MHRDLLLELLTAYESRWPGEGETIGAFRGFVAGNPACFERSLRTGHVTGSAWVVNEAGTHVLLTHHRKLNRWLQLGGHADGDADVLRVALREAEEESGLAEIVPIDGEIFDLDIHPIPARKEVPEHLHYDVRFVLKAVGSEQFEVSDESHDLSWVTLDELPALTTEDSMRRMAAKWAARR